MQGSSPANQGMPPGLPNSRPRHPLTREEHLHVDRATHICLSTAVFTLPYSGTGLQLEALQPWAHTGPRWGRRPIHRGQESRQRPKDPVAGKWKVRETEHRLLASFGTNLQLSCPLFNKQRH